MTPKQIKPKKTSHFVQTDRAIHESWARLGVKSPSASALLHFLVARAGENNAFIASQQVLAELTGISKSTIKRSIAVLKEGNWIEVGQIAATKSVNAYIVNSRVAWSKPRNGIRYALFTANVIISETEQSNETLLDNQDPIKALPKMGEIQMPTGDGLPPPSQPFLDGLEPDLPTTLNDEDDLPPAVRVANRIKNNRK